jgi:DMSO/TMAO reductase YedYZ molybdopterin-dependent catalytic subunit
MTGDMTNPGQIGRTTRHEHLPPGQYVPRGWPVLHYGPVPKFREERWDLRIHGATASGGECRWTWPQLTAMPRDRVTADFHCVTKFTITGVEWEGLLGATIAGLVPPADEATHVMIWAEYGYSANIRMTDFLAGTTLLATHRGGAPLTPEHGAPARMVVPHLYAWKSVKWVRAIEYLVVDRRGFWEERGYHNVADPWLEQRYSYQEEAPPA